MKIKGKVHWMYRAVDTKGYTVDFYLSQTQDKPAAHAFFEKSLKKPGNPEPEKITTDGHQAYPWAIKNLKKDNKLKNKVKHRTTRGLEQPH